MNTAIMHLAIGLAFGVALVMPSILLKLWSSWTMQRMRRSMSHWAYWRRLDKALGAVRLERSRRS